MVASWVELVSTLAVGAIGVPVKEGDDTGALAARAVTVAEDNGLSASDVLSTLGSPT